MKFSLFTHMERTRPDQLHQEMYDDFIHLCELADQGGMHAIWTGEHHGMDFTVAPNPFINIADIARRTKNVRLGTGTIVAPFWHPVKLAGEAAMTDIISNGRLEVGIARGAYSFEYERMMPGMDAWEAGQRMREIVPAIRNLWHGDYAHKGEFYQFPETSAAPKPIQQDGPPLWIAARDPSSHEFAIENDCNVQVTPLWQGDEEITQLAERFKTACDKKLTSSGHKPKLMLLHHCYVGKDDAEVETAAIALNKFYNYFGAWFKNERPVRQGQISALSDTDIANNKMLSPALMHQNMAIGTAQTVRDRLKKYQDMGYDEYAVWIDSGMSFEQKKNSLHRFMDDVMPAF